MNHVVNFTRKHLGKMLMNSVKFGITLYFAKIVAAACLQYFVSK